MQVNVRKLEGPWDAGYALDKHTIRSLPIGENEYGYMQFDTLRTDAGEALYQLKYRADFSKVTPLSIQLAAHIYPLFEDVHFLLPMPPSKRRDKQPVDELVKELARILNTYHTLDMLVKAPTGQSVKDIGTYQARADALQGKISINEQITTDGTFNALLVDDRYDTGASLEAAVHVLRGYKKIGRIYVATVTY